MIDVKHLVKYHAAQNIPLNYDEAYLLGCYALEGCKNNCQLSQIQSVALLTALHNQTLYAWRWNERDAQMHGHDLPISAADQIAGICAAIFQHDIAESEFGFVQPKVSYAMDNCGMGGDLIVTANLSTIAAFIAAAADIPMCKHGSPANADKGQYGSSDFISLICGIDNFADRSKVETCVEEVCFGYTEACDIRYKQIHMQTHKIAMLSHMNDIIGPITNPLLPRLLTRRVLGVNHLIPLRVIAEVYLILNKKGITNLQHGLFVRGFGDLERTQGMDEVSICPGGTQVVELQNGEMKEYELFAADFGLQPVSVDDVLPFGNKGQYSLDILRGAVSDSRLNVALANAAILFYLAGRSDNWKVCFQMAKHIHRSGNALAVMEAVKARLKK